MPTNAIHSSGLRAACFAMAACLLCTAAATAQDKPRPVDPHPWRHFGVGSWKRVRVHRETLDENGDVKTVSITETRATLVDVDELHYTLKLEVAAEVAGKQFQPETRMVTKGAYGESSDQTVVIRELGSEDIVVAGNRYKCQKRQIVINGDESKRVSTILVAPHVAPAVLRRETRATDAAGQIDTYQTVVDVLALDMPHKVLNETKPGAYVRTLHHQASGQRTVTMEVYCPGVPGGVVSRTERTTDKTGTMTQRGTLELLDYGTVVPTEHRPVVRRRRFPRRRVERDTRKPLVASRK